MAQITDTQALLETLTCLIQIKVHKHVTAFKLLFQSFTYANNQ